MGYTITLHLSSSEWAKTLTEAIWKGIEGFKGVEPHQTVSVQHGPGAYSPSFLRQDRLSQVSFHLSDYNYMEARRLALYVVAALPDYAFHQCMKGFYYDDEYCPVTILNDTHLTPVQSSPGAAHQNWHLNSEGEPIPAKHKKGLWGKIAQWAQKREREKIERVFQERGDLFRQSIKEWVSEIKRQPIKRNKIGAR